MKSLSVKVSDLTEDDLNKLKEQEFQKFSRKARYEGGEYLIEAHGNVLVAKTPKELFEKVIEANRIESRLVNLKAVATGVTKQDIAVALDKSNPMFMYNAESGMTSYRNYTRDELLRTCLRFKANPITDYHINRKRTEIQELYFGVVKAYFKKD